MQNHYAGVDFKGKAEKLTMDADTLISVCTYLILNAEVHEIFAHLKLGNQFATGYQRSSRLGFVASTFEVAIEQVLWLEDQYLHKVEESGQQTI